MQIRDFKGSFRIGGRDDHAAASLKQQNDQTFDASQQQVHIDGNAASRTRSMTGRQPFRHRGRRRDLSALHLRPALFIEHAAG